MKTRYTLDQVAELLKQQPHTAREIAGALGCCKPTAYKAIRALQARGDAVYTIRSATGRRGPRVAVYGLR